MPKKAQAMIRWSGKNAQNGRDVVVNVATRGSLLTDLKERMKERHGFTVATLNLDHVTRLRRSPEFLAAYLSQSHVTADGRPIVWLSRLAGQEVSLVPGSELIDPVCALAESTGTSVALMGATRETLDKAAEVLCRRYPGLSIVEKIAPPMGFDPLGPLADEAIERLQSSGAGICFVALGAPKQEVFAAKAGRDLPQVGFLSIGAGLDFIAGHQIRAPRLVRALAAEWLWRLAHNPRRLGRRYLACMGVLPALFQEASRARKSDRWELGQ